MESRSGIAGGGAVGRREMDGEQLAGAGWIWVVYWCVATGSVMESCWPLDRELCHGDGSVAVNRQKEEEADNLLIEDMALAVLWSARAPEVANGMEEGGELPAVDGYQPEKTKMAAVSPDRGSRPRCRPFGRLRSSDRSLADGGFVGGVVGRDGFFIFMQCMH
ncbi:hypothetical protein ACLOJK_024638 [Asimina triloba]